MVDLILLAVIFGAAYGGFRLGAKYKTIAAAVKDLLGKVTG